MPWIDFVSSTDRVSLWYVTNSPKNNVSSFDRSKPTIMMLHPLFLDSSWAHTQMNDPRLGSSYNMISFDVRSCGRSDARPSEYHDSWVDAADLAFAHQVSSRPFFNSISFSWNVPVWFFLASHTIRLDWYSWSLFSFALVGTGIAATTGSFVCRFMAVM